MKPKQTLFFLLLNILGYTLMAFAIYLYFFNPIYISAIVAGSGIISIVASFLTGLKSETSITNSGITKFEKLSETFENPFVQTIDGNDTIFSTKEAVAELTNIKQDFNIHKEKLNFDASKDIILMDHYAVFESNSSNDIILTKVDDAHIDPATLIKIKDKLNTYGLSKRNPLYDYRFDLLLKNNLINTKIWEDLYAPFPNVKIIKQHLDNPGIDVYLVKASLNSKNTFDLGYLPFDMKVPTEQIDNVTATLIGGNYHFIDDEASTFKTIQSPLSVAVRIELK